VDENSDASKDDESKDNKRVSFDKIEIREYPRCLGENPSVTSGPPLSIGWNHSQSYVLDVDQYENFKDGVDEEGAAGGRRRRTSAEFQLPWNLREQILRDECAQDDQDAQDADTACTSAEIKTRVQEIRKARRQRQASYAMQEFEAVEIFFESCWRKLQRVRCCGSKNRVSEADSLVSNYTPKQKSVALPPRERVKSRGQAID
jgi:hypothetical protein